MAKSSRRRRRVASRYYRRTPYPLPSYNGEELERFYETTKCSNLMRKREWEDVTCSVCMEYPHNAVLLLCSSYDKGCRPYMCGTSDRHSNCLDQYKKAYTKVTSNHIGLPFHGSAESLSTNSLSSWLAEQSDSVELACPLCRGQVKGWTVVDVARDFLNSKKRCCMQEKCSFMGNYKELRKHVRAAHPAVKPREVDPAVEHEWRRLENEREHADVMSVIRTSMPGARVIGDFVIGGDDFGSDSDEDEGGAFNANYSARRNSTLALDGSFFNMLLLLHAFESATGGNQWEPSPRGDQNLSGGRIGAPVDGSGLSGQDRETDNDVSNGAAGRRHRHRGTDGWN